MEMVIVKLAREVGIVGEDGEELEFVGFYNPESDTVAIEFNPGDTLLIFPSVYFEIVERGEDLLRHIAA